MAFSPDGRLAAADNDNGITVQVWDLVPSQVIGEGMADKLRKALDRQVEVQYQDRTLAEIVEDLERKAPGIAFVTKFTGARKDQKLTLRCSAPLPLGAALQMLEDATWLRIAARDYGILISEPNAGLPDGAIPVEQAWKGRAKASSNANLSAEGSVTAVDSNTGFITLSIGSNAGLVKGDTCEVYRLKPEAKYLGTVEIVATRPDEAVAKPTSSARGAIQVGNRIARNIKSR